MEIYIDQYYYFQGAPDRAGQPLQSAVTLQYKMLAKPISTNSESAKRKCHQEEGNFSENLNFIPKSQNENSSMNVKIISIKTPGTNASRSSAETLWSSTDQVPVCQSLSDSGKTLRVRASLTALSPAPMLSRSASASSPTSPTTWPETGGRNPSPESQLSSWWLASPGPTLISSLTFVRLVTRSREVTMIPPTSELGVRDSISTLLPLGLVIL